MQRERVLRLDPAGINLMTRPSSPHEGARHSGLLSAPTMSMRSRDLFVARLTNQVNRNANASDRTHPNRSPEA